jgi:hypothetical protein
MALNPPEPKTTTPAVVIDTSPTGALVKNIPTERAMRPYAFYDSDLDNIGTLSIVLNALIAVGGSLFGVAVSALCDRLITKEAMRLSVDTTVLAVSSALIVIVVLFGVWISNRRTSTIERIKKESRDYVLNVA